MGYYKLLMLVCVVQAGLLFCYVYHQSTLSHLYYQYQKAEQQLQRILVEKEQRSQQIQTDHNYAQIAETVESHGMKPVQLNHVTSLRQDAS